jgi:hypothetical protein
MGSPLQRCSILALFSGHQLLELHWLSTGWKLSTEWNNLIHGPEMHMSGTLPHLEAAGKRAFTGLYNNVAEQDARRVKLRRRRPKMNDSFQVTG